jgi:hypothetical protein
VKNGIAASLGFLFLLSDAASAKEPPASTLSAAENRAPKILKPAPGVRVSGDVMLNIEPAPGTPTKNFALDWQAKKAGEWTARDVLDAAGLGDVKVPARAFKGAGEWRVRARAIEAENGAWSEWREFRTRGPAAKKPCARKSALEASYDVSAAPAVMTAGATLTDVPIKVTNLGNRTWGADGEYRLSYHWAKGKATVVRDGETTPLEKAVRPGGTAVLGATLKAPAAPGTYTLKWDMLRGGADWFSAKGVATGDRVVSVKP